MIRRIELQEHAAEWGLSEQVVEKDYILSWLLWGIATDPVLGEKWVFKGGTCLKKCYIETFRFSEDLDFTVLPDGPLYPEELASILPRMLARLSEASGIDFSIRSPSFRRGLRDQTCQGRIYYRGPRGTPTPESAKLDLDRSENVVRPPVLRPIGHSYSDRFPEADNVRCYSFEELFAEKIRAMQERCRPRDLYDIIYLFRRPDLRLAPDVIRNVLEEKCRVKGITMPTFHDLERSPDREELISEWGNMLRHQLPALPPLEDFWGELPTLFAWLEGQITLEELPPAPITVDLDEQWTPPPTVWSWGQGVPLETVRFAAANHLCVDLGYDDTIRRIEPYSLRRTRAGDLLLYGRKVETEEMRAYRVDRIQGIKVTTMPFKPVFRIEFSPVGLIAALPTSRSPWLTRPSYSVRQKAFAGPTYVIACTVCGKRFRRKKLNYALNPHKGSGQTLTCPGRTGYLVDTEYD